MNRRLLVGIGAATALLGGLLVVPAALAQTPAPTTGTGAQAQGATITADQARTAALAAVPGTVLEIELENEGGRTAYEVEIRRQSDNRVVEVMIDPTNASVLGQALDDDDGPLGVLNGLRDDD